MYKGSYVGKILRINLTNQSIREEPVSEELARNYLDGAGFAIKYLYDDLKPGLPPLFADNQLILAVGALTATSAPYSSRMAVSAKSPLTNAVGMALAEGHFPAEMKKTGYDMIIIEGRAKKPI